MRIGGRWILGGLVALVVMVALTAWAADETPARSKADVEAIEGIIRDYLLRNPQVIVDALQALERRQEAEKAARVKETIVRRRAELSEDSSSPVGGNERGDVTVVEFFDYRCPHCRNAARALAELVAEDRGVRVVYKEFPILGPDSLFAARAALAARLQGRYEAFHRALMAEGTLNRSRVLELATSVGLDTARLEKDMQSPDIGSAIRRTYALAEALSINATPAFIVGDELRLGALDRDALRALVARAREKKDK